MHHRCFDSWTSECTKMFWMFWMHGYPIYRSSQPPEVFCKKGVLRNFAKFTGKHLCQRPASLLKKTLAQLLSCEFREIFKNTFFTEHHLATTYRFSIRFTRALWSSKKTTKVEYGQIIKILWKHIERTRKTFFGVYGWEFFFNG